MNAARRFQRRGRWLLVTLGVCILSPADTLADRRFAQEIDRLVRPYLDAQQTHALSVGVLRNGRTLVRGYGRFSESDDRKPDGDTLYEIASLTKVFTGVLLADSSLRGEVQLTQPAGKLLPPGVKMPSSGSRPITLLDLATHVSGLPRLPTNLPNANASNHYAGYTTELLYEFLDRHELRRPPGVEYEYSNLAYGLLGRLLAQRTNTDYETLLAGRVTKPLRMRNTFVEVPDESLEELAPPHRADLEPTLRWNRHELHGAGAINSCVKDLLTFARVALAPRRNRLGAAIELSWKQHRPPVKGTEYAMGLGWFLSSDGHTRYHTGSTGGYRSAIYVSRDLNVASVVLANAKCLEADDLAVELYRAAIGREVPTREYEPIAEVSADAMRKLAGKYKTPRGGIYDVKLDGEKLMVRFNQQKTYRVFPVSATQWKYRNFDATLIFQQDDSGGWNSLELIKPTYGSVAQRIEDQES